MNNQELLNFANSLRRLQNAKTNNKPMSLIEHIKKEGKRYLMAWTILRTDI